MSDCVGNSKRIWSESYNLVLEARIVASGCCSSAYFAKLH